VHAADDLRLGQREQVVVALEVAAAGVGMVVVDLRMAVVAMLEALAAKTTFVQLMRLQHGAHATVEDQDAPMQRLFQQGDAFGVEPGQGTHFTSFG
jgi:hypothetical protein